MLHTNALGCIRALPLRRLICGMALGAAALGNLSAQAQTTPESVFTRGELLYSTHCIECHTTQMHWRANPRAVDWDTLKFQVRRWQGVLNLGWTEADVNDVARYLNDTFYRFAQQVSRGSHQPGSLAAREPNCARSSAAAAT
jgi:mono/diheme cytochrome c family protein